MMTQNSTAVATAYRVGHGKAMLSFALIGGLISGSAQALKWALMGNVPYLLLMASAGFIGGALFWAVAGALYTRMANRSSLDFSKIGARVRIGAKSGAIMTSPLAAVVMMALLIFAHAAFAKMTGGYALGVLISLLVALLVVAAGALQGSLIAAMAGGYIHGDKARQH